jgi:hypothetical protein
MKNHTNTRNLHRLGAISAVVSTGLIGATNALAANKLLDVVKNATGIAMPVLIAIVTIVGAVLLIPAVLKQDFSRMITVIVLTGLTIIVLSRPDQVAKVFSDIGSQVIK